MSRAPRAAGRAARARAPSPGPAPGGLRLPGIRPAALPAPGDRDWYRRAVFYEVLIRGFSDGNGDGIGDLAGLRAKLDYLEWLGIDCLWLLPYYPSPMRDGGYDISDFFTVHPDLGTLDDLGAFLDDAHRRKIRVIADLVMNHTSDQHPWFVESRSSRAQPEGRLVRLERRRRPLARGACRLRRRGVVQLDLGAGAPAVLLAPLLLPPAGPQLRAPRSGRLDARHRPLLARHRPRRVPPRRRALPLPAGRDVGGEPARDPRHAPAGAQGGRRRLPRPGAARRGQPVAWRPRRLLRRRRRVPHVLPLPAHAPAVHGRAPRAALPGDRDPGPDPRDPRGVPVGHLPAQPRRARPWRRSPRKSATTWSPST